MRQLGRNFLSPVQVQILNTTFSHLPELAYFQRMIYPDLTERERYTLTKYHNHLRLFPEGQFVAIASENGEDKLVGATSTFRITFDFKYAQHAFRDISADGWLNNHDPQGDWLYGAGLEVHPDFRHRGIGGRLYAARQDLARRLNLKGEIVGGMLPGYNDYRDRMSAEEFVWSVATGKAYCPTLTMQLKYGFRVLGVLRDHLTDPQADNCCSLIARDNPDYVPEALIPVGTRITAQTQFRIIEPQLRIQEREQI